MEDLYLKVCIAIDRQDDTKQEEIQLPVTPEQYKDVLRKIGVDAEHSVPCVVDFESNLDIDFEEMFGDNPNISELNYLAGEVKELNPSEKEKLNAILTSGICLSEDSSEGIVNLPKNLDTFDVLRDVQDCTAYGDWLLNESHKYDAETVEDLYYYIDLEALGRDTSSAEHGAFSDIGYIMNNNNGWEKIWDGSIRTIPKEYNLSKAVAEVIREQSGSIKDKLQSYMQQTKESAGAEHTVKKDDRDLS